MTIPEVEFKKAVQEALATIIKAFPEATVGTYADGQGGMWVELTGIPLGDTYEQDETFLVFLLPYALPGADIYPMFVRSDLSRADGAALGEGFAALQLQWPPGLQSQRSVVQLSRVTRAQAFTSQTAAQKIVKVLDWLMTR